MPKKILTIDDDPYIVTSSMYLPPALNPWMISESFRHMHFHLSGY